jgi:hypothetical protein
MKTSIAEFGGLILLEMDKWARVVERGGIKPQ